jgi:hypothetical protein
MVALCFACSEVGFGSPFVVLVIGLCEMVWCFVLVYGENNGSLYEVRGESLYSGPTSLYTHIGNVLVQHIGRCEDTLDPTVLFAYSV